MKFKTYQPKGKDIKRAWHLFDAEGEVLGRLATQIAILLMGKQKATYSPNIDSGDNVVVLNSQKIVLKGKKSLNKKYYRHSGYPGGFKEISIQKVSEESPEKVIYHAVSGMLPDNKLKKVRLARLKILRDDVNPYSEKFKSKETK